MSHADKASDYKPYKFKALKAYASTEWLADNRKKYRQVFDRYETTYIYTELSFYNKRFDEEDWEVKMELRCYSVKKDKLVKQLCALPFQKKVSKYDNIVYLREGWGNKKNGAFWQRGTYFWEAWIEGEKVGTKYFYIEEVSKDTSFGDDAYLDLESLSLYEGSYDDVAIDDRIYYRTFSSEETRYIYVEIMLRNLNKKHTWQCELFTKFYNDARELKAQVVRLHKVEKGKNIIQLSAGCGANVSGSWPHDKYTAELVFMDKLLAVIPFEVSDDFEQGIPSVFLPDKSHSIVLIADENPSETFEDVILRLDALIGLKEVKQKVREHAQYIKFLQLRKERGFEEKEAIEVHSVFLGNPGTGKTTVAKMMGRLYRKMGLLTKGHVHEVDRAALVGEYIGQTAPKVKEAIEKARGGVLFIDEAYALARSSEDTKDFGREVIEILVKEMSNGKGDLAVIVAGYPKEMNSFLGSNPGLKSRFKINFEFSDYLPQELSNIAKYASKEKEVILTEIAKAKIDDIITEAYRTRDRTFGNARFVYDLIEKAKIQLGLRVMNMDTPRELARDVLEIIDEVDIDNIDIKPQKDLPDIPIDESLLAVAMAELDALIGMESVKKQIKELTQLVRYHRETGKNVLHSFFLHTVFVGNPGTGKTTVARILTKIYKALGVLERGHTVETDRQGLVAGYVGQTATKTAEKVDEAMGGVLFIDEAYALSLQATGARGDFGDEAIQTLLKRMEDKRGQFFVFVAGYPDNMEQFLKTNPGLNSRFDKTLKFEDYTPEDLLAIFKFMLSEKELRLAPKAELHLQKYLVFLHQFRDKYFGNARAVRQLVTEAIKNQNLRLAALSETERQAQVHELNLADVESFKLEHDNTIFNKRGIGFQRS